MPLRFPSRVPEELRFRVKAEELRLRVPEELRLRVPEELRFRDEGSMYPIQTAYTLGPKVPV